LISSHNVDLGEACPSQHMAPDDFHDRTTKKKVMCIFTGEITENTLVVMRKASFSEAISSPQSAL
jgi:hypothetical protein